MTRTEALTWAVNRYGKVYTKAGLLLTDSADGFGPPLDDAWLMLGLDLSADVLAADTEKATVALRFSIIRHVRAIIGMKYNKVVKSISLEQFDMWKAINEEYKDAWKALGRFGLDGVSPTGDGYGGQASYDEIDLRPKRAALYGDGGLPEFG